MSSTLTTFGSNDVSSNNYTTISKFVPIEVNEWNNIRQSISPLDIVFFKGGDKISYLITKMEKSDNGIEDYSHVGLVITSSLLPNEDLDSNKLYVFESTATSSMRLPGMDGIVDVISGEGFFGAQLRDLDQVIPNYLNSSNNSRVAIGVLRDNPWNDVKERPRLIAKLEKEFRRLYHRRYERNPISLLSSRFRCLRPTSNLFTIVDKGMEQVFHIGNSENSDNEETVFCSELVAIMYQRLGLIDKKVDPQTVLPTDFIHDDDELINSMVIKIMENYPFILNKNKYSL